MKQKNLLYSKIESKVQLCKNGTSIESYKYYVLEKNEDELLHSVLNYNIQKKYLLISLQ